MSRFATGQTVYIVSLGLFGRIVQIGGDEYLVRYLDVNGAVREQWFADGDLSATL